jgi:Domain of unknown function (DUF3854)
LESEVDQREGSTAVPSSPETKKSVAELFGAKPVTREERQPLTQVDEQYFVKRAISKKVVAERGYFRVSAETARKLGLPKLAGMVLPIRGVNRTGVQLKPDVPELKADGKPKKYPLPSAKVQLPMLDVLRPEKLSDIAFPLLVTESIPKADAATTAWGDKLLAIGMIGVFGFRGQRSNGAKLALPCWESVGLNRRTVFLVPDGNVRTNRQVYAATVRLRSFLESKGAETHVVVLPDELGLDDWLHSMEKTA